MSVDPADVPVQDASTVILLRPAPQEEEGYTVYLTRRRPEMVFAGGMHVFPGGKVDPEDEARELVSRSGGLTPERAMALLKEEGMSPARAFAFWVGAVRELFEEAGVLLARQDGKPVQLARGPKAALFDAWRRRLNAGQVGIAAMVLEEDLELALGCLHYVSHWVTPVGPPRRFNTHFFITALPDSQEPTYHAGEADESLWIAPRKALEAWGENRLFMIPPTVMSLQSIAAFDNLDDVLKSFPCP